MLAARIFGVNAEVDAFMVAFKLPNFMRNLFAEGSFSQAFVPTLSYYREKKTPEETQEFIRHVAGCLGFVLLMVTLIGLILMPILVKINAPGFDTHRFSLAVDMSRITFPYLMLVSLAAFAGSILNSYGKFGLPAFAPALLNIVLIIAALFFAHHFAVPIESQAWGILIAGLIQLIFLLIFLKKLGFLNFPKINWQDEGVRRVLKLMVPALFGASIVQIGLLINTIFASFLPVGSITWLYYSERLAYFPQGVFGVALATVVLPHLSRQFAQQSEEGFQHAMDWGIRCNLLVGIPAALTMAILSGPLIATLFQYGHFSISDVLMTQKSVIAYAVGLQAFMLLKVLSSGFYARLDIRTPVRIGLFAVGFNILMNAVLVYPLKHAGLALATSLSSCFNVLLLIYFLYKKSIFRFQSGWLMFLLKLFLANLIVGIWLYFAQGDIHTWLSANAHQKVFHLSYLMFGAMMIYFLTLRLCGLRLKEFMHFH